MNDCSALFEQTTVPRLRLGCARLETSPDISTSIELLEAGASVKWESGTVLLFTPEARNVVMGAKEKVPRPAEAKS